MWWRAAAVDALQAYVAGPLALADAAEQGRLQRTLAQLLAPTLEAICSHAAMQVRSRRHCRVPQNLEQHLQKRPELGTDTPVSASLTAKKLPDLNISCQAICSIYAAGSQQDTEQRKRRLCWRCGNAAAAAAGDVCSAAQPCCVHAAARDAHQAVLALSPRVLHSSCRCAPALV